MENIDPNIAHHAGVPHSHYDDFTDDTDSCGNSSLTQQALSELRTRADFDRHCKQRYGKETHKTLSKRLRSWTHDNQREILGSLERSEDREPPRLTLAAIKEVMYKRYRERKLLVAHADAAACATEHEPDHHTPGSSTTTTVPAVVLQLQPQPPSTPLHHNVRHPPSCLTSPTSAASSSPTCCSHHETEWMFMHQQLHDECLSRVQSAIDELTRQQQIEFAQRCEQWEEEHRAAEARREEQWQETVQRLEDEWRQSQQRRDETTTQRLVELSELNARARLKLHTGTGR
jgi:hypothetical protein